MPLYEYRCLDCGVKFERLVHIRHGRKKQSCTACHSSRTEKILSVFSVVKRTKPGAPVELDGPGESEGGPTGILLDGAKDVTIQDCVVDGFETGIRMKNATGRISGVEFRGTKHDIVSEGSSVRVTNTFTRRQAGQRNQLDGRVGRSSGRPTR